MKSMRTNCKMSVNVCTLAKLFAQLCRGKEEKETTSVYVKSYQVDDFFKTATGCFQLA